MTSLIYVRGVIFSVLVAVFWKREECVEIEDVLINTNVDVSVVAFSDKFHRADTKSMVNMVVFTGYQCVINESWRIREVVFNLVQ